MSAEKKIVLHSLHGYRGELDAMVDAWIDEGVIYVGVVGVDAARLEDIIDELCVLRGYFMLTASHEGETLEDAIFLAATLADEYAGPYRLVDL
ncbi:MAG: hypothetical protein HOQ32_04110 [Lysobacter sp.]|nr:hypothetical protein [Lysobacter sp.]